MSTRQQTILSLLIPAIVSIIPATYTYCQSMYEVRQKYNQSHHEAEAGYAALVTSVKELQDATKMHHDDLLQIHAYLRAMEQFITTTESRTRSTARSGNPASVRITAASDLGSLARARPVASASPDLTEPAPDLDSAAKATAK